MSTVIMGIYIVKREDVATCVQNLLTKYGCIIKTRLGLHESLDKSCSSRGLIILEFIEDNVSKIQELQDELNKIDGVTSKTMDFNS